MRSGTSIDNESFHTAYSGDEFSPHPTQDFDLDEAVEAYEQYSAESASESDAEGTEKQLYNAKWWQD